MLCFTDKGYLYIDCTCQYNPSGMFLLQCYCQACMGVLSVSLVASLTVYSTLVLPRGGYYFNLAGLGACDPFYPRPSIRILAACSFYFPTTMILMYCYGSAFHVNKIRRKTSPPDPESSRQNNRDSEIHAAAIEKVR